MLQLVVAPSPAKVAMDISRTLLYLSVYDDLLLIGWGSNMIVMLIIDMVRLQM